MFLTHPSLLNTFATNSRPKLAVSVQAQYRAISRVSLAGMFVRFVHSQLTVSARGRSSHSRVPHGRPPRRGKRFLERGLCCRRSASRLESHAAGVGEASDVGVETDRRFQFLLASSRVSTIDVKRSQTGKFASRVGANPLMAR